MSETATGWSYQPFASGGRANDTTAVGALTSTRIGCVALPAPDGPATVHDELATVSRTYDWGTQPDVGLPPSIGLHVQASVTPAVYQPDPQGDVCPPEVHIGVTV